MQPPQCPSQHYRLIAGSCNGPAGSIPHAEPTSSHTDASCLSAAASLRAPSGCLPWLLGVVLEQEVRQEVQRIFWALLYHLHRASGRIAVTLWKSSRALQAWRNPCTCVTAGMHTGMHGQAHLLQALQQNGHNSRLQVLPHVQALQVCGRRLGCLLCWLVGLLACQVDNLVMPLSAMPHGARQAHA
jgi:hypothetical protein